MKVKTLGLLAVLAMGLPVTTQASYVYAMRADCVRWIIIDENGQRDRRCPAFFRGTAVVPDSYVPGTTYSWGPDDSSVSGYFEIDHPYFGVRMPFYFAEADAPGYISLPVVAGPGAFEHEGPTWMFHMFDRPSSIASNGAAWVWANEVAIGVGSIYFGGPLVFRRIPEPGTLALLGLGLAGLGLSRRRQAA